ncbi:MAG: hypothetical protein CMM34_07805 [Rhodospirillaceae bacterium]|nr:hypothetical protein [Rhodospirillaceae bacterium]
MSGRQQNTTIQDALDLALKHHQAGRLSDAEDIYEQILQTDPKQPVALHLLGVTSHQVGKNDVAVDLITKALDLEPNYPEAHNNLGLALQALNRPTEAIKSYRLALSLRGDYADAYSNLGDSLQFIGKHADAVFSYRKALNINPGYSLALNNLGNALQELGQLDKAVASYKASLKLNPNYAAAHNNLGNALRRLGKLEEAVASYRQGLTLETTSAKLYSNLGEALRDVAYRMIEKLQCRDYIANENKPRPGETEQDNIWDDVDDCANQALKIVANDTQALALKAAALIGKDRLDKWSNLCDFNRLIQTHIIDAPVGHNDLRSFNKVLLERCANDESRIFEVPGKAITNGERVNSLHMDATSSPVSPLLRYVDGLAKKYAAEHPIDPHHPFLAKTPKTWRISAWSSILRKQGYHEPHIHKVGWLSGVYYGRLPDVMGTDDEKQQGCIEFGRPINYVSSGNNPQFHVLRPKEGMVVLFPAYFYHRTIPFDTDDTRFTVAFDLIPLS